MNAEARRSTAIHEAGHAVAAWTFDVEMRLVSIRETDGRAGAVHFNPSGFEDDVTCAVVLVAGEIAQRIASGCRGGEDRFNWLNPDGSGDCDAEKARWFTDGTPDPLLTRRLVDLKAASLLRVRWAAVLAIADELERRTLIMATEVDRLCRAAGALKVGQRRYDPDKHMVRTASKSPCGNGPMPWRRAVSTDRERRGHSPTSTRRLWNNRPAGRAHPLGEG